MRLQILAIGRTKKGPEAELATHRGQVNSLQEKSTNDRLRIEMRSNTFHPDRIDAEQRLHHAILDNEERHAEHNAADPLHCTGLHVGNMRRDFGHSIFRCWPDSGNHRLDSKQ